MYLIVKNINASSICRTAAGSATTSCCSNLFNVISTSAVIVAYSAKTYLIYDCLKR